jgi:hypothetical protein
MLFDDMCLHPEAQRPFMETGYAIVEAVPFWVSAIDDYLYRVHGEQYQIDFRDELPNCAPLAPAMWFEWTNRITLQPQAVLGVAYDSQQIEDGIKEGIIPSDSKWLLEFYAFWRRDRSVEIGPFATSFVLGGSGCILETHLRKLDDPPSGMTAEDLETHVGLRARDAHVALTAICFAHCKGVMITDHQQPRQQRRAAERAGRPPLVTYKTIDIAPVTRILRDEGQIEHNGLKRALHITRGHFARYTPDAPLFGKYTGTFYRPMHVRGSLDRGVVVKDYNVTDKAARGVR